MLNVSVVVGNPKPESRTRRVAELLVEKLLAPGVYEIKVIDLAYHIAEIFTWPSDEMSFLSNHVANSDMVVFASPTYKATYTGMLKAFLDRYPANGLAGVIAIPVLTGADETHSMGVNVSLSPLLIELGAIVPGSGLYFITSQMDRIDELVESAARGYAGRLRRLARVAAAAGLSATPAEAGRDEGGASLCL